MHIKHILTWFFVFEGFVQKKGIQLVRSQHTPSTCWRLWFDQGFNSNHGFECPLQRMFKCWTNKHWKKKKSHLNMHPNHKRPWVNKVAITNNKGKWKNQTLEETMDAIERRMCSLMVINRNIPLTSLLDHLSWKTR
jgi:hypothetical protein